MANNNNQQVPSEALKNPIQYYGMNAYLKFLIPSLIGVLLFIVPYPTGKGSVQIGVGFLIDWLTAFMGTQNTIRAALVIVTVSALSAIITKIFFPKGYKNEVLNDLFNPSWPYTIIRIVACILAWMVRFQKGPQFIIASTTGGMSLNSLMPALFTNFLFCGFFLPLLMDFGAMDFVGALLRKFMKPLFTIPGRSSLDCISSFIGSGTVGIMITTKQYDEGYYTGREAANIACCWSICSLPFALVCAKTAGVGEYFVPIYLTVVLCCIVESILLPRIAPLSKISDTYNPEVGQNINEQHPEGVKATTWAVCRASSAPPVPPGAVLSSPVPEALPASGST